MRLEVLKTYKIYIGGKFPRTESGRYYTLNDKKGKVIANMCQCSRKDVRDAVTAARSAFGGWAGRAAFNRSQILYRIAEMLEGRRAQFQDELMKMGYTASNAKKEIDISIDRFVYYSGWCDKYQQMLGTVNPVASSHFNFSVPEPTGVVGILADESTALVGMISPIAAAIAGGNTCVVLASEKLPLCAVTFAEVLNSSDLPGGVVNILTGSRKELAEHFALHMDVNAFVICGGKKEEVKKLEEFGAENVKRVIFYDNNWNDSSMESPYFIADLQEIKTTWHPIENIGGSGGGY